MSNAPGGSFRALSRAIRKSPVRRGVLAAPMALAIFIAPAVAVSGTIERVDPAVAAHLRVLDCARVGAGDVANVLARVPAPRIVLLQGSVAFVTMEPFARFLIAMGYPAARLANPRDGAVSYGSFGDSAALAGELAFDYERTGLAPMMIGHSQGGMLALRTLYELAGAFHDEVHVVDPATRRTLDRTSIVDPHSGRTRPVVGLHVAYVAALATGWLPRLLLGQWSMLPRLRRVPDTVDEFTGFSLPHDAIAGNLLGESPYVATGHAYVRNVTLPARYHHVALPRIEHLAADPAIRAWIDSWSPDSPAALPPGDTDNLVHAADIWYSIKRHWCLQARHLLDTAGS
jgi:hypothetical protein